MKTRSLISQLYRRYPKSIAEMYEDYVGLMVGKLKEETSKILLCLDFDESIFLETLEYKPDLIITHHPFFYGDKKEILKNDEHKAGLTNLLNKYDIPLFSIHTNFDGGTPGMNDAIASKLKLKNIYAPEEEVSMRIGELDKEMEIIQFVLYVKKIFNLPYALLTRGNNKKMVKKVAVVGGGGSPFYEVAQKEGADIYISGDAPHHVRRRIIIDKFNYLDVPHEIERIFMQTLKDELLKIDPKLNIKIIDHEKCPIPL